MISRTQFTSPNIFFPFGDVLFSRAEPQTRKQSLDDINLDQFLKIANYEDTVKELDIYYGIGGLHLSNVHNWFVSRSSNDNNNKSFRFRINSEAAIASIPEPNIWLISSAIDWHWSWQCSGQCILCGGRMESISGVQVWKFAAYCFCAVHVYKFSATTHSLIPMGQCHIKMHA